MLRRLATVGLRNRCIPNHARYFSTTDDYTEDPETDYFELLLREYPNIASKGHLIIHYYETINQLTKPPFIRIESLGFGVKPSVSFGRVTDKSSIFLLHFVNKERQIVSANYGSTIIYSGFKAEASVRMFCYFTTGISQIMPEIPRALEIESGWELSLVHLHIAKFRVYELPTQRFWRVSLNIGAGLGFQRMNGILYVNDAKLVAKANGGSRFLSINRRTLKAIGVIAVTFYFYSMWGLYQQWQSTPSINYIKFDKSVDPVLPTHLYEIRNERGRYCASEKKE